MDNGRNQTIYQLWAPVYDKVMGPFADKARRHAIELLNLQPGESVLLSGVGTGLDLPHIRADVQIVGIDLSPAMLRKAQEKVAGRDVLLCEMNAQALDFPDSSFDVVILNLILSVVPDGAAAFREAWRVLRPGGRGVIFDKFAAEDGRISALRRGLGKIISLFGTDPNRRLSEIMSSPTDLTIERNEPSLLHGQYRIVLLHKRHCEEAVGRQSNLSANRQEIASPLAFPAAYGGGGALGDTAHNDGRRQFNSIEVANEFLGTTMDQAKWQQPIDKLAPVVKEAQAKLRAIDRAEVAARSGATIDRQGNLRVEFLQREYVIDHVEWTVIRTDDGTAPPSLMQGLILTYLYTSDGTPPIDRWMGFRELPNGMFYAQAFQGYTGAELVRDLNGDVPAFRQASEKLRGEALAIGDAGYVFQVLPRLKLAVVMWAGDDEFPSQAQMLFPESAPHYLVTEGLAIVGSLWIGQIVKAAKA